MTSISKFGRTMRMAIEYGAYRSDAIVNKSDIWF